VTGTGHRSSFCPIGAYGIALEGLSAASELLVPVAGDAPAYAVESAVAGPRTAPEYVDEDSAELTLRSGGRVLIDRLGGRIRFELGHAARPDELVHPYLAPAAAVVGRWLGRESVHAGAIAVGGRALGVVGEREAGKSSTLARWALDGGDVLCDDMLVIEQGFGVHVGPRSIDLREDAAGRLGAGEAIGVTGARERWRLRLAQVGDGHVLAGFAYLAWADSGDVGVRRLGLRERLERLVPQRGLRLEPARHDALLELAALPAWELSRPRSWRSLPEVLLHLRALVSTTPTAAA
jgi:hypothetical protein